MSYLFSSVPAPSIGEIVTTPDLMAARQNDPFYAYRDWVSSGLRSKHPS